MTWLIRNGEVVQIKPKNKVKIGSNYQPKPTNYVEYDQLWVQDVFFVGKTPWSWIRWKTPQWIFGLIIWFAVCVILNLIARRMM